MPCMLRLSRVTSQEKHISETSGGRRSTKGRRRELQFDDPAAQGKLRATRDPADQTHECTRREAAAVGTTWPHGLG